MPEPLSVDVLDRPEQLSTCESEWRRCFERSQASPYLSYDWFAAAIQHRQSDGALRVCLVRHEGELAAVVPLELVRDGRWHVILRFAGGGWAPRNTCVVADAAVRLPLLSIVLQTLHQRQDRWAYCHLKRIPADSPLRETWSDAAHTADAHQTGATVLIMLPATWDEYWSTLSESHRKNIRRRTNLLTRTAGALRLERVGPGDSADVGVLGRLIDDALAISRRSWQGDADSGRAIGDPHVEAFFRDVTAKLGQRGLIDLSVLYAADRPVSFVWGAARRPTSTICKLGFDRDLADTSPGLVHLAMLLADSIERKLTEIDFGHEFSDYKRRWSKVTQDLYALRIYPRNFRSKIVRWWHERQERRQPVAAGLRE